MPQLQRNRQRQRNPRHLLEMQRRRNRTHKANPRLPATTEATMSKRYTRNDSQYIRNRKQLLATSPACHYCNQPANTVDHVIELDRWNTENLPGSPHTLDNMVPACRSCNSRRGAQYGNAKRGAATKARNAGMAQSAKQRAKHRPPANTPTQTTDTPPRGILGVAPQHRC